MKTRFHLIAAAISAAFVLAAPMAQAALDKFPEAKGTKGGSLYVVDPTQPITVTLGENNSALHPIQTFYWRDGVNGEWQELFTTDGYQNATGKTFTLQPTSGEVFFATYYKSTTANYGANEWYGFSTGDGSLNWYSDNVRPNSWEAAKLALPHAAVIYDTGLDGNVGASPNTVWVGFEDDRYIGIYLGTTLIIPADWDDFQFQATNLASSAPEPETYAMLLAGLGIVGFAAKRRRRVA